MKKPMLIIFSLWLFIILVFVVFEEFTLRTGVEVLLKTVPVDPRDLLRGDYVVLNYDISSFERKDEKNILSGTVYSVLNVDDKNIASISRVQKEKPSGKELFIKGKTTRCNGFLDKRVCIEYGIESYFVKENEGKKLEQNLAEGALVRVAVDKNGRAKVLGFKNK